MSRTTSFAWILFAGSFAYLFFVIAVVLFKIAGPSIEARILPPVKELRPIAIECRENDLYFKFFLGKRDYFNGLSADLKGLNVRSGQKALAWRRADLTDRSPLSAPPGDQQRDMVIIDACGKPFVLLTQHQSPVTGLPLFMRFGPFGG